MFIPIMLPVKPKNTAIGNNKYIFDDKEMLLKQSKTKNSEITRTDATPMLAARRFLLTKTLDNNEAKNAETEDASITNK